MAQPKEERNKLLFMFVVIIGLLALIVYLVLKNEATWVIATFTVVLAIATIWNIKITQSLLEQSKESSKQSRRALEIDVFNKIVSSTGQYNAELRISGMSDPQRTAFVENFATGMLTIVKDIDSIMFQKISKEIKIWNKRDKGYPAQTFLNALGKIKQHQKTEEKEFTNAKNSDPKLQRWNRKDHHSS